MQLFDTRTAQTLKEREWQGKWSAQGTMSNWSTGAQDEEQLEKYLRKSALNLDIK